MSTFINERRMVDDTLFNYEKKFHSPLSRFIDKTPIFSTWFHIADDASTTDMGFNDVDDLLGVTSPLRYKKIEHLPVYGLDRFVLQIEDTDQGLDRDYEGSLTLINSTIVPLQNDMFMLPSLKDFYIFRVIAVHSDHIMTDNYYSVDFKLEYIDREKATWLNKQTVERYYCNLENIGTERKCIIRSDIYEKIQDVERMYNILADTYRSVFYSERYNCFLGEYGGPCALLYDPFQVEFIIEHDIFNQKGQLDVIIPTMHFKDSLRKLKYERSVYRFFERRDLRLLSNFAFNVFPGANNPETGFARYYDCSVYVLDIPDPQQLNPNAVQIFSDEFVSVMKLNGKAETRYGQLLIDYIRKEDFSLDDIPLNLEDELFTLNANMEIFFFTPIILYIIRRTIDESLKKDIDPTSVEV